MKVTGESAIYGVLGCPIEHTLSPAMHNAAYEALGLKAVYAPFLVKPEDLGRAVLALRALNISGVNVTIPHKSAVMEFIDETDPSAKRVGAVNVIIRKDKKLIGHNTDAYGFLLSLRKDGHIEPSRKRFVVLGAGGAASAVVAALAEAGVRKLVIANRTKDRAEVLAKRVKRFGDTDVLSVGLSDTRALYWLIKESDVLVNATSMGLTTKEKPPINLNSLHEKLFVMDVVYGETPLLKEAKKKGLKTLDGLGMLVSQGAQSFELMTGKRAPFRVMRSAAEQALKLQKK